MKNVILILAILIMATTTVTGAPFDSVSTDGLIAHFSFEGNSSSEVTDLVTETNGTLVGSASIVEGIYGNGRELTSASNYEVNQDLELLDNFTYVYWVRELTPNSSGAIIPIQIADFSPGTFNLFAYHVRDDSFGEGYPINSLVYSTNFADVISTVYPELDTEWHMYAFRFTQNGTYGNYYLTHTGNATIFYDGQPITEAYTEFVDVSGSLGKITLGTPYFISAQFDEFLIFNTAKSDEELALLYEEYLPEPAQQPSIRTGGGSGITALAIAEPTEPTTEPKKDEETELFYDDWTTTQRTVGVIGVVSLVLGGLAIVNANTTKSRPKRRRRKK